MPVAKSPEEMIHTSQVICQVLNDADIVDSKGVIPKSLENSFQYEMLKLAIYLADADGQMDESERDVVKKYFESCPTIRDMRTLKIREQLEDKFVYEIPSVIRYAALADQRKLVPFDLFREQKAQVLVDTFAMFGRIMISVHPKSSVETAEMLTDYVERLEDYLKGMDVYYPVEERYIIPKEVEGKKKETDWVKLESALGEVNAMIGLTQVKREINGLVNLIKVQKMREERGMKTTEVSMHMVFMGNPGTGKTTIARSVANLYKYMGLLTEGQLVETDRAGMVCGYVGQTAARVKEVVSGAIGGVLFIDEAYSLVSSKSEGDYGQEAIDTLLKEMEDHRDNLVVIVAGYPDLMKEFIESNPGLKSRFNRYINFEDYTPEEQMQILDRMCNDKQYLLDEQAREYTLKYFTERMEHKSKDYANARDVRNFLEQAISNHAGRVVTLLNATMEDLQTIRLDDVMKCEIHA